MMEPWLIELLVFLPAILFLGIKTSYDDIKEGKIRNKYIIFAVLYALIAYVLLITFLIFRGIIINYDYIKDVSINLILALFVGYIIWHIKLWSAADGKLFIAYAALVPLGAYSASYYKLFPSFVLLINTFVPFFAYTFFKMTFFTTLKKKKECFKNINKKEVYLFVTGIFWITWIFRLFNVLGIKLDFLVGFAFILILLTLLEKIFKKGLLAVSLILCLLRLIFDYRYIFTFLFFKQFLLFLLFITAIFFIMKIAPIVYTKKIKIVNLKKGMILAEQIYKGTGKKKYNKISSMQLELTAKKRYDLLLLEHPAEGLTQKDLITLKKLYKIGKLSFKEIKIQQTLPFAPFMFLGVLLTLIAKGNFLIWMAKLIRFI